MKCRHEAATRSLWSRLGAGALRAVGLSRVNQVGSHIILQTETPRHHRVSIPDHRPLRIGTLNAVQREIAVAKGVLREDILATM